MQEYLRVKIKSLAAETRIIRHEERKAKSARNVDLLNGLVEHRKHTVRKATRSTLLAYGFLRNRQRRVIEATSRTEPDWDAIEKMISRYGYGDRRELMQRFSEWRAPVSDLADKS